MLGNEKIDRSWALPCNCGACDHQFTLVIFNPWGCEGFAPSPTEIQVGCYLHATPHKSSYGRAHILDIKWEGWLFKAMEKYKETEHMGIQYGEDWNGMCPGFSLHTGRPVEEVIL